MELDLLTHFFFAVLATCGFGFILQVPSKSLVKSGLIGGMGWAIFIYMSKSLDYSTVYANFSATIVIAILSEIAARLTKQPVNIYIIPGVLPLVPGLGMYQGMSKIISGHYEYGMNILMHAGSDAGAIAIGMMLIASFFRMLKITNEQSKVFREKMKNKVKG